MVMPDELKQSIDQQRDPPSAFEGIGSLLLGAVLGWIVVGLAAGLIWAISGVVRGL